MNLKLGDRVGLNPETYMGAMNACNPAWDSFMGRIGGTVRKLHTAPHQEEDRRVFVEWDTCAAHEAYRESDLFPLTSTEDAIASAWGKNQIPDTRDLVFLAYLPDQKLRLGVSYFLSNDDAVPGREDSPYMLVVFDEGLDQCTHDGELLDHITSSPYLLLGYPCKTHFHSFAKFNFMQGLQTPRAIPRKVINLSSIVSAMAAVPEAQFSKARAVFTVNAHTRQDGVLSLYDLLFTYIDTQALESMQKQPSFWSRQVDGNGSARTVLL